MNKLIREAVTGKILQHMNHTEDLVLEGKEACDYVYRTLEDILHALKKESSNSKIRVKLDGAPNFICATNYRGLTFVGTKYAFKTNTSELREDKLAFSVDQLDNVSSNEIVKEKLRMLFKALPYINIPKNEIWSGDYLFSQDELKTEMIEGEECICFHPNTIVYAVPKSDPLSNKLLKSEFGVAWHTKYTGPSFEDLQVNFDVDMSQIQEVPGIFQMDATLPTIRIDLSSSEISYIESILKEIKIELNNLTSSNYYSKLQDNPQYIQYINMYRNALIRINNQEPKAKDFLEWLGYKYDKFIDAKKTQKAKDEWVLKKENALDFLKEEEIDQIYKIQNLIRSLKEFYVDKLNQTTTLKTYLKYKDKGFVPANAEGYAVSDSEGNVQKIVSRLEFSKANFSQDVIKGWSSEKRDAEMREKVKKSKLKRFKESSAEDTVENLKNTINVEDKKAPSYTHKGSKITYTLQPTDNERREDKASKAADLINNSNFYYRGTTPIVEFEDEEISVELIFKPRTGGAVDTKGDEIYWAYCMACTQNNELENLPSSAEDIVNFNMTLLKVDPNLKAKPSNIKGYTEGSELLCNGYLDPEKSYLFFREDVCINLINNNSYESIHSLINKAAKIIGGASFQKDIWNPSDVVACSLEAYDLFKIEWEEALQDNPTFEKLNQILLKYIESKDIVGVSLKDVNKEVHIEEVNINPSEEIKEDVNFEIKSISYPPLLPRKEAEILYPQSVKTGITLNLIKEDGVEVTIQYRLFSSTTMQIEGVEKGHGAKLGKAGKFILNDLYQTYGVESERELSSTQSLMIMNENPASLLSKIKEIENSNLPLTTYGEPISEQSFMSFVQNLDETNETTSIWPRIIDFLYMLVKANNTNELNSVLNTLYKGAKKEFDWCAPFVKIY